MPASRFTLPEPPVPPPLLPPVPPPLLPPVPVVPVLPPVPVVVDAQAGAVHDPEQEMVPRRHVRHVASGVHVEAQVVSLQAHLDVQVKYAAQAPPYDPAL